MWRWAAASEDLNASERQQQVGTKLGSAHVCCYFLVHICTLPVNCSPIPLYRQGWKTCDIGYGNCFLITCCLKRPFSFTLNDIKGRHIRLLAGSAHCLAWIKLSTVVRFQIMQTTDLRGVTITPKNDCHRLQHLSHYLFFLTHSDYWITCTCKRCRCQLKTHTQSQLRCKRNTAPASSPLLPQRGQSPQSPLHHKPEQKARSEFQTGLCWKGP